MDGGPGGIGGRRGDGGGLSRVDRGRRRGRRKAAGGRLAGPRRGRDGGSGGRVPRPRHRGDRARRRARDLLRRGPALAARRRLAAPPARPAHRAAAGPGLADGVGGRGQLRGCQHRQHRRRRPWPPGLAVAEGRAPSGAAGDRRRPGAHGGGGGGGAPRGGPRGGGGRGGGAGGGGRGGAGGGAAPRPPPPRTAVPPVVHAGTVAAAGRRREGAGSRGSGLATAYTSSSGVNVEPGSRCRMSAITRLLSGWTDAVKVRTPRRAASSASSRASCRPTPTPCQASSTTTANSAVDGSAGGRS